MKCSIDFSLLSRPSTGSVFVRLPDEIERAIEVFQETSERIEIALRFCWFISGDKDTLYADEPKATRLREAFLRASLAEYVSVEDTLKRDLHRLGRGEKAIKITDLKNPLLHIIREMRNLEIHLTSSKLSSAKKDVVLRWGDTEHQTQTIVWTVSDLTVEKFSKLDNAKRYKKEDIKRMVVWFNEAQHDWGVAELLFRAICELASCIVRMYALKAV